MNKLAEQTIKRIESEPGYNYNRQTVIDICEAGIDGIVDGTIITIRNGITMRREGGQIVARDADGNIKQEQPIAGNEDRIVAMYAYIKSRNETSMGSLK